MRIRASHVVTLVALCASPTATLLCQDNAFDLRIVEVNAKRDITYQNFIYARSLAGGRFLAQANYLRLPGDKYSEVAAGIGVRVGTFGDASVYVIAGAGRTTEALLPGLTVHVNYAEPAILVQDTKGRLTGTLYVQRYVAVNHDGVGQWLLDMLEAQYAVRGPLYFGAVVYAYRADGDSWLTKVGPKIGVSDRFGSTEARMARANRDGSPEIQLRRIVVF